MSDLDGDARSARRIALYFDAAIIVLAGVLIAARYAKPDNDLAPPVWKLAIVIGVAATACVLTAMRNTAALAIVALAWLGFAAIVGVTAIVNGAPKVLLVSGLFALAAELHWSIRRKARKPS